MIKLNSIFQEECYCKALNKDKFLIAAKCRFGKTYVASKLIHDGWDSNITFILSGLNVRNEWEKALIEAGYISNETLFTTNQTLNNLDLNSIARTKKIAIFISLQKLNYELRNINEELFDFFNSFKGIKTIVIDEAHFGEQTEKSHYILSKCNMNKILYLSATPYTNSIDLSFDENSRYTFTYLQEQKTFEVSDGSLDYTPIKLNLRVVNKYIEITDNDTIEDWKYLYENKNKDILKGFIENSLIQGIKKLNRHNILILCDSIISAKKLSSLLNTYDNVKAINVWEDNIDSNSAEDFFTNNAEELNFITTVNKLGTGSTIPSLDCVAFCCNTKSAIKFIQCSMRACSPKENKTSADILVFNKFGAYEVYRTIASLEAGKKENATLDKQDIKELQRYLPIFIEEEVGFKELDYAEITDFNSLYVKGKARLFDYITSADEINCLPLFNRIKEDIIDSIKSEHPNLKEDDIKEALESSFEDLTQLLTDEICNELREENPEADFDELYKQAREEAEDAVDAISATLEDMRKQLEQTFIGLIEDLELNSYISNDYSIKFELEDEFNDLIDLWGLTLTFLKSVSESRPEYISSIAKLVRLENK